MRLTLTVLAPERQRGKVIPVAPATFIIGRDPGCQLRPASPLVSQRHCALLARGGKVFLRDFGSTNGTFLNGRQVQGEAELLNGDRLRAGPLIFAVGIGAASPAGGATPPPTKAPPRSAEEESAALLLAPAEGAAQAGGAGADGAGVPASSTEVQVRPIEQGGGGRPGQPQGGDSSAAARTILE
jgi:predicted component of type VI protein secretion system